MCLWEEWDAQIPSVQLDSCGNSRGSEIWCYLHRKSQCSDFHNNFLLNDAAFRPQERGHEQLERQKKRKDIFNRRGFFPAVKWFTSKGRAWAGREAQPRLSGALSMARVVLWPRREQGRAAAGTVSCHCHPPHSVSGAEQNLPVSPH